MNERCINEAMLHIVQNFGDYSPNGERIILNNKSLSDLEKWARDSKILDIFEGTQQIQLLIVARRVLNKSSAELK